MKIIIVVSTLLIIIIVIKGFVTQYFSTIDFVIIAISLLLNSGVMYLKLKKK